MAERAPLDAIELELFTNRFSSLVEEMGERLRRTAVSVNVKERRDFSCALLDPAGRLVANAPHIPVHLGSLGLCVRRVTAELELGAEDVAVTNHPAYGGSHLPDVTVVSPVFDADANRLGYVANRAHHAEIGGTRPGSMPPDATTLAEEGVVIPPVLLVRDGRAQWDEIRRLLATGPYPSRSPRENLADLEAAVAANARGSRLLRRLARAEGSGLVLAAMRSLASHTAAVLDEALEPYIGRRLDATERLDDGSPLSVRVRVEPGRAQFDFSGSAPVHPGNLNATPGIVRSVVLYFLRLLLDRPLPLNEGLLESTEIVLAKGILDPPFASDPDRSPAVVGGNVETSQRLVDALIRAFELSACSQGTMNNVLFGDETFGYYETVGGGAGATATRSGADAVHTHMTNTAITDPELLEHRYPVRLERFAVRRGSGGRGQNHGGDGIVRQLLFLAPLELSVLSQHRVERPYGLEGGHPGRRGRQTILRAAGGSEALSAVDGAAVQPGDRLVLESPGGGGFGSPEANDGDLGA